MPTVYHSSTVVYSALARELAEVLMWETAVVKEGQVLLHA